MKAQGTFRRSLVFSLLWTNLAVAVVDLIILIAAPSLTARDIFHTLAFTLVYANLTSMLAVLVLGWLFQLPKLRGFPQWALVLPGVAFFTALGCLVAQGILTLTGIAAPSGFWLDYFGTLRFAMPLALVFGLGAMTHASLLFRVQAMEQALHEKELAEERSRKLAAEVRLRSLESWIHPHFLFNTLNSISALIPTNPQQAEHTVGRLATLLRTSLDTSEHSLIPLHQEIALVESYLDIERVRLGPRLRTRIHISSELRDCMVPPMSVQSLVENAVKHGIVPQPQGGELVVSANADPGNTLRIEVRDSGPGFTLADLQPGHGLDKLIQRIDALYGQRAHLNIVRPGGHPDSYSGIEIILPAHEPASLPGR